MAKDPAMLDTLGDMTPAEQEARWENDPHELPWTKDRADRVQAAVWLSFAADGYSPEALYPNDSEERAKYRAYLSAVKLEKAP